MPEPDSLAEAAIDALSSRWPELCFRKGEPGTITLMRDGDDEEVAVMSLAPLEERVALGQSIEDWLQDPQVMRMLDIFAGRVDLPDIAPEHLVLRLSSSDRFSEVEDVPLHRELFEGVWELLCGYWEESGVRYLVEGDLDAMGLDKEEAWDRASKNTDEALRGTNLQGVPAPDGGMALIVIEHTHASWALRAAGLRELLIEHLGEPCLACIPASDEVIVMPCQPRDRANGYLARAKQSYLDSSHPVSDRVLLVDRDGFVPE